MPPHNLLFGGGVAHTIVNPFVLAIVLILGLVILLAARRRALAAFLFGAILIPQDQVLLVSSLHFDMLRVLLLFGFIRLLSTLLSSSRRLLPGGWNKIDAALVTLTTFIAINGILLWKQWGMVIFQFSLLYEAFGIYFLLRTLIRNRQDLLWAIRCLVWIALVIAAIMTFEHATGTNPVYSLLGGARADIYGSAMEREGHFRAVAVFGHPILAGTFGAVMLPLFFALWLNGANRTLAACGMAASLIIPLAANSSTSLIGLIGGLAALCLWPLRHWLRPIRWGFVIALIALHLLMKAPVWHLISRVDLAGGSSSYHRYQLVNQCILHFNDWWLIGTRSYANWGWDMWDLSNQYVGTADTSGLIPLLSLVAIFVFGFHSLGRALSLARTRKRQLFVWAIGSALFAHAVALFGVAYFDQSIVGWYTLLAIIPVVQLQMHSDPLPVIPSPASTGRVDDGIPHELGVGTAVPRRLADLA